MMLYMTELEAKDWPRSRAWYRDVLGLSETLVDEPRGFALLGSEGGRIALKRGDSSASLKRVRLVFQAEDLEADRARLIAAGVAASEIVEDGEERFRSFRAVDPEGTPITVFAWAQAD